MFFLYIFKLCQFLFAIAYFVNIIFAIFIILPTLDKLYIHATFYFNLIQDGPFQGHLLWGGGWGGGVGGTGTVIPYLKKAQKIYESREPTTP